MRSSLDELKLSFRRLAPDRVPADALVDALDDGLNVVMRDDHQHLRVVDRVGPNLLIGLELLKEYMLSKSLGHGR